ncbi:signal peptidase I [Kitasatospora sp. GAS204B]|uniref:signal peptidase I n=1 Tax=unclassified Kitasatospora TaxID=2633591 RepID=UPI00247E585A|nr:signal peptidase I [Kitasatospora sp. GAS204B]
MRELPVIAMAALVMALLLKTFLVQVFVIPSGSMENTIDVGDRVMVDRLTPWFGGGLRRGDVVVFKDPGGWLEPGRQNASDPPVLRGVKEAFSYVGLLPSDSGQDLIKRVIGVGGDTVACCDAHGRITVNGTGINEPYLADGNVPSRLTFRVTVPEGRLWVMGDHRDVSADSRYHMRSPGQGTIPLANVVGRAIAIAWPVSRVQPLDTPAAPSSLPAAIGPGTARRPLGLDPPLRQPRPTVGLLGALPCPVRRRPAVRRRERCTG